MKPKLQFTFALCSVMIFCSAQDTIVVDAKVGKIIDLAEKNHFRLFPFYSSKIFTAASFIKLPDATIVLETKFKNDSSAKKMISPQEFELIERSIKQSPEMEKPRPVTRNYIEPIKDTVFVPSGLKKNVVYGTLSIIGIGAAATGNIERMLFETRKKVFKSIWVKAYAGGYAVWEDSGQLYGLSLTSLSGTGNDHLELSLGLSCLFEKSSWRIAQSNYNNAVSIYGTDEVDKTKIGDFVHFFPGLAVGYRYQAPGGHFVFRTGVCVPELLYLSLGFCF